MIFEIAIIKPLFVHNNMVLPHGRSTTVSKTKQRQISRSVLLLLLWFEKTTSFPVCGSVYIKYIVLHHLIMREFFNYSATLLVSPLQRSSGPAPRSALKLQPVGVDGQQSMQHSCSGTHEHPVKSQDFTGFTEAVAYATQHAT